MPVHSRNQHDHQKARILVSSTDSILSSYIMEEIVEALQSLFIHPQRVELVQEIIGKSQFEVRAAILDRQHNVAVKLISFSSVVGDARLLSSLKKEILAMHECQSKFVVHLLGVCLWENEKQVGIVMERMANSLSLYAYGNLRQTLSYLQIMQMTLKMAQGLEFLHSKGFVHRDVKPENILVSGNAAVVKWSDFGLASALLTSVVATKTNVGAGTPIFMSPEQTNPRGIVTRAADVWSFGCVILSLLTGTTPWPADWTAIHLLMEMVMRKATPTVPDNIPVEMQTLLRRCLAWEFQDRPTASQIVSMLQQMLTTTEGQSPSKEVHSSPSPSSSVARVDVIDLEEIYRSAQNHIHGRRGFVKDAQKAANLLKKAADLGHARSMFEWGKCLTDGAYGTIIDTARGNEYIASAATNGSEIAQVYCLFDGLGSCKQDAEKAFNILRGLDKDDPFVLNKLGYCFGTGNGVRRNEQESVRRYEQAADACLYLAQYNLGLLYANGQGVVKDEIRAFQLCKLAAEHQYAAALCMVGLMWEEGRGTTKDENKAFQFYQLAASQGNAQAQCNLGVLYEHRQSASFSVVVRTIIDENMKRACALYQQAADQGLANAQYNLAMMYEQGTGVQLDEKKAVQLYQLAADQGHAGAQCNLGLMFEVGRGGPPRELTLVVSLFKLAADQGNPGGLCNLGRLYESGRGIEKDELVALQMYQTAADLGYAEAQSQLAHMYEDGRGAKMDKTRACSLYQLAANQKHPDAQNSLGLLYANGVVVEKDEARACDLFQLAANSRYAAAQNNLGVMYERGQGSLPRDYKRAAELYELAARQGNAEAECNLGSLYENGFGVEKDLELAVEYYRRAALSKHPR